VQVDEGLAVANVVEESVTPPPPMATAIIVDERTVTETTAPKRHWDEVARTW
jgi:hypothetical protein